MKELERIYLDHSATTPMDKEVLAEMLPYFTEKFGNPSSIHAYGREVKKAVEEAREKVAKAIGAQTQEIIFTSGGTEADNMAIKGVALANTKKGKHIITSAVEHHAILDTCKFMKQNGYEITYVPVDKDGLIKVEDIEAAIKEDTILISIMHANNEIGTIQPIAEIGKLAKSKGIIFHTDAVQTIGKVPVNVEELNVDLLSISAHKFYGPKGVGALYIRKGTKLLPISQGGAQERKRRPGTENTPGIIGLGKAIELAIGNLNYEMKNITKLRNKLINGVLNTIPNVQLNGHAENRLPGNANFSFNFIEGESLLLSLDMKGIAGSSGSACTSGSLDPSHVLLAIGLSHEIAHGSLRLTLGKDNTEEHVDYVLQVLPEIVGKLREMSPLYHQKKECSTNV
jgi:cysteine desulfurase